MNEITTQTSKSNALASLASRLEIDPKRMAEVLKATAFKACKTDEQFAALLIVSNTYGLNPLTKEIYAFPGKGGEIVPIVSIDGWLRIINDHPQMDGMRDRWADDGSWCEVTIYRKDRTHPTTHREHLSEAKRPTEPWKQHTRRMLKWKTIIQTSRIAFGFGGIHDADEGMDAAGMRHASGKVIEDEPTGNPFVKDDAPAIETTPPTGKQTKERHTQNVELIDISDAKKSGKKTWWTAQMKTDSGSVCEMGTFSETMQERLAGNIGSMIEVTFTQTPKGGLSIEDFEVIPATEGGAE